MPRPQAPAPTQQMAQALTNLYFNGFELGYSFSDISMILMIEGQPQLKLSMSFTTAKTLQKHLTMVIENFEKATDHKVMTMDEVQAGYARAGMLP